MDRLFLMSEGQKVGSQFFSSISVTVFFKIHIICSKIFFFFFLFFETGFHCVALAVLELAL